MFTVASSSIPSRSRHVRSSSQYSHLPISKMCRNPRAPTVELDKAIFNVEPGQSYCTITGEVEIDLAVFLNQNQDLTPYSIGLSLAGVEQPGSSSVLLEWNQDGPGNYNRSKSFIRIHNRLLVDLSCFVKFTIRLPEHLMPIPGRHRLFTLGVKAYALDDAFVAAEPVSTEVVVFNPAYNGRRGSIGKL